MGLQGLSFIGKYWVEALAVAFLFLGLWGALKSFDDPTFNQMFTTENNESIIDKGSDFLVMAIAYGAITPSYRYELPFTDKYIIGINDIPFFDLSDLIILVPVWVFMMWILKKMTIHQNPIWNFLLKVLIVIVVIVVVFLLIKVLQYYIYLNYAQQLGIPIETAIQAREKVLAQTDSVSGVMAIIAFFGGFGAVRKLQAKYGK